MLNKSAKYNIFKHAFIIATFILKIYIHFIIQINLLKTEKKMRKQTKFLGLLLLSILLNQVYSNGRFKKDDEVNEEDPWRSPNYLWKRDDEINDDENLWSSDAKFQGETMWKRNVINDDENRFWKRNEQSKRDKLRKMHDGERQRCQIWGCHIRGCQKFC